VTAPAVTVQHLVKRYGHLVAVNDVSLSIHEGETFGIIGPNGAGKTTTVECISGLRAPDSGSISVYGLSPQKDRDAIREFVGVQLQESALPPRLRVGEALRLFASFYSNPVDPDQLLETLGMKQIVSSSFKNLSGRPETEAVDRACSGGKPQARHPRRGKSG
jgi:ABC-2 type transport system ATP-binding protein